jgi:hypothetical protein
MIGHPAKRMQAVFMLDKNAPYDGLPDSPIRRLQENILPGIATQYHVIKAATHMGTGLASHAHLPCPPQQIS